MPALKETHAAAVRACGALLEAFDPNRPAPARRASLLTAIEFAMDATAMPKVDRPDAGKLIGSFGLRKKVGK